MLIHMIMKIANEMINVQLPPKEATLSAIRCPKVISWNGSTVILSCLAALQAPVIMMSQNRQEEKDRERAKKDYMINLKSELEIRVLHEKIDHLMMHQQKELIDIQNVQLEMMNKILVKMKE